MNERTPQTIFEAVNPAYTIDEVVNILPFGFAIERIGATAGRIYLRENKTMYAVTASDILLAEIGASLVAEFQQ